MFRTQDGAGPVLQPAAGVGQRQNFRGQLLRDGERVPVAGQEGEALRVAGDSRANFSQEAKTGRHLFGRPNGLNLAYRAERS